MPQQTAIHLHPSFFGEADKTLVEHEGLTTSTFLYPSGVHGLRLANEIGHLVVLPYQGQQIWDAQFFGRILTRKRKAT